MDEYDDPLIDMFAATNAPTRAGVMSNALRRRPVQSTSVSTAAPRNQEFGRKFLDAYRAQGGSPEDISFAESEVNSIRTPTAASSGYDNDWLARNRADQARVRSQLEQAYAEPDLSGLQQEAQRRQGTGTSQLLLALAAQQAGQEFAPVSAHYLKQAAAAREPVKFAGGYINETGQIVRDPLYQQEQRRKMLEAQGTTLSDQERKFIEEQGKNIDRDEARRSREQYQQGLLGLRGQLTEDAATRRKDAADERRNTNTDRVGARVYDDFMRNTKDQQIVLNAHENLKATAQRTDGPADISFLYQYMKMLDPNSVVRETEFATAQNAGGVPDRIRNLYNRAISGERLNPELRAQFLGTAANIANAAGVRIEQVRGDLARQLEAVGGDPKVYLPGFVKGGPPAAGPGGLPPLPEGVSAIPIGVPMGQQPPQPQQRPALPPLPPGVTPG